MSSSSDASQNETWIVQKYGGTSVGKQLPTIAQHIAPSYLSNPNVRLAIVCSARSGQTKALGTTNLLLQAAKEALQPEDENDTASPIESSSLSNSFSNLRDSSNATANGTFSRLARSASRGAAGLGTGSPLPTSKRAESPATLNSALDSKLKSLTMENSASNGAPIATGYNATVDRIMHDHIVAVREAVTKNVEARERLEHEIVDDCERLRDFLMAAKIIEEISPKSQDIIMSIGERLSCRIVVGALLDVGIDAELVGMETVIDANFLEELQSKRARLDVSSTSQGEEYLDQAFYDLLSVKMADRLRAVKGVPVVTGFFGHVPGSLLSQVGRGYTDLCAALCAVGLQAAELQIWKEVDGVFTADPRKVSTARLIDAITPEEAAELTYYGSEVIHPFTMEQAIKKAVPIRIKNVENPEGSGTVIFPPASSSKDPEKLMGAFLKQPKTPGSTSGTTTPWGSMSMTSSAITAVMGEPKELRRPTAVTIKEDIWILNVHSNRKTLSHGFFARIFTTLDKHGVIVDLISTSEVHVSMALHGGQAGLKRGRVVDRLKSELSLLGEVSIVKDMTILSLVGSHMRNMVGVSGKMFNTLAEGNINIEMISQGANEINISCVIHQKNALKALNMIHYSVLEGSTKMPNAEAGNFGRAFF
ncbi:aspartate kinase [Meira miltonrushii]|uniref:aspartate kinase n=1 Tax=Meira miltonrushii TaxID=1280837 RepID=A0A316V8E4_9BASI|nr:aspartate kinase [Meira miltonrushii]PWN33752.1 aspartate kinase [Meira miltonrushii]